MISIIKPIPISNNTEPNTQVLGATTETKNKNDPKSNTPATVPTPVVNSGAQEVGQVTNNEPETPVASASPTPQVAEYLVAADRDFETDKLKLSFKNIKMSIQGGSYRSFRTTVVLVNKNIAEGIKNQLSVSIVKDGNVIISKAPMSVSESKLIMPGQQLTYTASIGLIAGTDVKSVNYNPSINGVNAIDFVLLP